MPPALSSSLALFLALALPFAAWAALRRTNRPGLALPLVALGIGAVLFASGLWSVLELREQITLSQQSQGKAHTDTYYLVSSGWFVMNSGLFYLACSALVALIQRLGRGIVVLSLPPTFAAFHLSESLVLLTHLAPPVDMPRRYVDYPDAFRLLNQITSVAAFLTFVSVPAMILLLIAAVVQRLTRRTA